MQDGIFALATASVPAPLAMLRLSGNGVAAFARSVGLTWTRGAQPGVLPTPLGDLPCLVWVFPAPTSFTGEDSIEIFVPSQSDLLSNVQQVLESHGFRIAEPGEFSLRAMQEGKLTRDQAESIQALIHAEDEAQRQEALRDLSGATSDRIDAIRRQLLDVSAQFESSLDFSEEEHVNTDEIAARTSLSSLAIQLAELSGGSDSPRTDRAPSVVLCGLPNAGKSSLFNAILGNPRSLVSDLAGTTRDTVRTDTVIESTTVSLCDVAGVGAHDSDDGRFNDESHGVIESADLVVLVCHPDHADETHRWFRKLCATSPTLRARTVWAWTHADVATPPSINPANLSQAIVSNTTDQGLNDLRYLLGQRINRLSRPTQSHFRQKIEHALQHLQTVSHDNQAPIEAVAGEVRRALTALDEAFLEELPGDVLSHIFSSFCIGK